MNKKIENMNFKRIFIIYLVLAIIVGILLCTFLGITYKDKLSFMYNYHRVSEQFVHNDYNDNLENKLSNMASSSNDVVDILVLDKNNKIKKSFKNSEFGRLDEFILNRLNTEENYYFENEQNKNVVFKLIKDEELMVSTILSDQDLEILDDYEDDIFFETEINQKDIYLLSYAANKTTGEKVYFINNIHPVTNGAMYINIATSIIVFFFMLYWVLVALMVYQNALKLKLNPYLWGGITLVTNIAGVILYLLYKQLGITCKKCNTHQDKNNIYCISCGEKLNKTCSKCNHIIKKGDKYCSNCGRKN